MNECSDYFARTLSSVNLTKVFNLPSWIPTLTDPVIPFNLEPPTYQQISNVIRKMKASGSPCPLDPLSIICFKQCPFLRTYLSQIVRTAWSTGSVPSEWKWACTILIHKKENLMTLLTSVLLLYNLCLIRFLLRVFVMPFSTSSPLTTTLNMKFKKDLHQVFVELLSTLLKWLISLPKLVPNSVHSSLLFWTQDLKNAFGEVHHNLIQTALDYHHIPDHIKSQVKSLYTDFKTSILTNEFRTPFISVGRVVLQGDCLSPLLFNLCFNTFLQRIKSAKYRQFGFSLKFLNPIHWSQFADDAAVISGQE